MVFFSDCLEEDERVIKNILMRTLHNIQTCISENCLLLQRKIETHFPISRFLHINVTSNANHKPLQYFLASSKYLLVK